MTLPVFKPTPKPEWNQNIKPVFCSNVTFCEFDICDPTCDFSSKCSIDVTQENAIQSCQTFFYQL